MRAIIVVASDAIIVVPSDAARALSEHPAASARTSGSGSGCGSGSLLLSAGADSQLRWWDTTDGLSSALGHAHAPAVRAAALCQEDAHGPSLALTAGDDGSIYLWALPDLTPRARLVGHTQVGCAALAAPPRRAHRRTPARIARAPSHTCACPRPLRARALAQAVLALATVDGGLTVVSASLDESVRLWDVQSGECLALIEADGACSMATSEANQIFVGAIDGCVTVIEPVSAARAERRSGLRDARAPHGLADDGGRGRRGAAMY